MTPHQARSFIDLHVIYRPPCKDIKRQSPRDQLGSRGLCDVKWFSQLPRVKVVSQSERLPAHTARSLLFPGLLRQCIRRSNQKSGVISQSIQSLLEARESLWRRLAPRPWRAPATYHSDPDMRCVWKD